MKFFFTASLLSVIVVAGFAINWAYQNKQFAFRAEDKRKKNEEDAEEEEQEEFCEAVAEDTEEAEEDEALLEILIQEEVAGLNKRCDEPNEKSTTSTTSTISQSSNTSSTPSRRGSAKSGSELVNRKQHFRAIRDRFESLRTKPSSMVVNETVSQAMPTVPAHLEPTPPLEATLESTVHEKKTSVASKKHANLQSFLKTCSSNLERMKNGVVEASSNQKDEALTSLASSLPLSTTPEQDDAQESPEVDSPLRTSSSGALAAATQVKSHAAVKKLQQFQLRVPSNIARYGSTS